MKITSSCVFALILTTPCLAATHVVNPDGTGDFPTIQAAIDGAADGDEIVLTDGVFTGDGNRDVNFLGKAVTVRSQSGDPATCIIDCEADFSDRHRGFRFDSGEGYSSVLSGVTVTNGYAPEEPPASPMVGDRGGGIICFESSPRIENCRLFANRAGWGGGAQFWDSAAQLTGCIVDGNTATSNGGGIYCSLETSPWLVRVTIHHNVSHGKGGGLVCNTSSPIVRGCTISHNSVANSGGGLWTINGSAPVLENTIISFSLSGASVLCETGGTAILSCCDVFGNPGGDWVDCIAGQLGQSGNIRLDPLYCNAAAGDYTLAADSPCVPFSPPNPECDLIGAWPVGCGPTAVMEATWGRIKARYRP
jgi:predicted outer membrane repeat protein